MSPRPSIGIAMVLLLSPIAAHAYVDPGAGMVLVQGLIALIGGVVVFVKNPIAAIKTLIARFRKK